MATPFGHAVEQVNRIVNDKRLSSDHRYVLAADIAASLNRKDALKLIHFIADNQYTKISRRKF